MSVNKVDKTTGELVTLANGTRMWIGTKTAHDLAVQQGTMPNNCMVCITDDAAGEDAWKYSTEETNTGKTWIDGKPIYRRVIVESSDKGTQKNVDISAWSIDTCVKFEGSCSGSLYMIPINTYRNDVTVMSLVRTDGSRLILFADGELIGSTVPWKIIIEYTKTTD